MLAGMLAGIVSVLIDKHSFYDHLRVQFLREMELEESSKEKSEKI
jgi:hypothetical protein